MLHGSDHGTKDIDLLINMGLRNLDERGGEPPEGLRQVQEAHSSPEQPNPRLADELPPGLAHDDDNDFGFEI